MRRGSDSEARMSAPAASPWSTGIFVIGAQKAGSTYLHGLLCRANPALVQGRVKEVHFFSTDRRRTAEVAELFPGAGAGSVLLDSSTSYLHNPGCAGDLMAAAGPGARVVAVVRDPMKRIVSAYLHRRKHGTETRSLAEVLALPAEDYAGIRAIERERAREAMRRGRIVARRPRAWPWELTEDRYDDPLWNFMYVSNSFYHAQSEAFRGRFGNFTFVDMGAMIGDPGGTLEMLAGRLGLPLRPAGGEVDENTTRYRAGRAARRFVRNQMAAGGAWRAGPAVRGAARLLAGRGMPGPEDLRGPWVEPLLADYAATRAMVRDTG